MGEKNLLRAKTARGYLKNNLVRLTGIEPVRSCKTALFRVMQNPRITAVSWALYGFLYSFHDTR